MEILRSSFTRTISRSLVTRFTPSIIRSDRRVTGEYTPPMPLPSFGLAAYQLPFAARHSRGFQHEFTFVSHRSAWLALSVWGTNRIGTLPCVLQSLHLLGVSLHGCHKRSESAALTGFHVKALLRHISCDINLPEIVRLTLPNTFTINILLLTDYNSFYRQYSSYLPRITRFSSKKNSDQNVAPLTP